MGARDDNISTFVRSRGEQVDEALTDRTPLWVKATLSPPSVNVEVPGVGSPARVDTTRSQQRYAVEARDELVGPYSKQAGPHCLNPWLATDVPCCLALGKAVGRVQGGVAA